jgi:hypothetical protein
MRTIILTFLLFTELGLLLLAMVSVQPAAVSIPAPFFAAPAMAAPFGTPVPIKPAAPPDVALPGNDCPADNVRKQSCESRYVLSI